MGSTRSTLLGRSRKICAATPTPSAPLSCSLNQLLTFWRAGAAIRMRASASAVPREGRDERSFGDVRAFVAWPVLQTVDVVVQTASQHSPLPPCLPLSPVPAPRPSPRFSCSLALAFTRNRPTMAKAPMISIAAPPSLSPASASCACLSFLAAGAADGWPQGLDLCVA
ncbi:hypothetical protein BDZ90DRAFT_130446 [Jaminaea rosea]|uniref:Uncharacterized protein n=1 Tax=Jaminaea rosea TaxID=1569628 RepID=A0A316UVF9_9BASI|nr:hypothetical protein BDZ90DRAFT_130446 [Jaminaea rosea]PWN28778.1 hypothetical protein BDZ90DRAFT_130446 [Jaminaea rosea]